MTRPALVVIDMQNDFLDTWTAGAREGILRATAELVRLARLQSCPVVWVRQEFKPDLSDAFLAMKSRNVSVTIRGTDGAAIARALPVEEADPVVVKKRFSAFFGTKLDELLAGLGVDTLILAGINTHACIRMTAIDAYQRDWPVIIASDSVGSWDQDHHEVTLRYLQREIARSLSNREIGEALSSRTTPA